LNERIWAEVDLNKIEKNIRSIRNAIGPATRIIGVVKADAYGHGAPEVSKTILASGADSLGVATIGEALELREIFKNVPILILGYNPDFKRAADNKITQTVYDFKTALEISKFGRPENPAPINLKVDTGMRRIGLEPEEIEEALRIFSLPNIKVVGIYTHLADSGAKDKTFAEEQLKRFLNFTDKLKEKGAEAPIHISNSGAILTMRKADCDAVRAGVAIYGLSPLNPGVVGEFPLYPAMSLKAKVARVKTIEAGETVGYGRTYAARKKTTVATIAAGYADGVRRGLGNKGRIIIGGKYAPIIGTVCMDQFMADVTGIKTEVNDEAIIFGESGDLKITADELADLLGTINYEIVCGIGKRVPRIYAGRNFPTQKYF
jgi:alanine racemase